MEGLYIPKPKYDHYSDDDIIKQSLMEGIIETGYRYWIDTMFLSRMYPIMDDIEYKEYPYKPYYGSFFDTKQARDKSFRGLMNFLKYKLKQNEK